MKLNYLRFGVKLKVLFSDMKLFYLLAQKFAF